MASSRDEFEAWAKAPPREWDCYRHPQDASQAWPGQYMQYHVQSAWEAWLAARGERQ